MTRSSRALVAGVLALGLLVFAAPAVAAHTDRPSTQNLHPLGHIEEPRSFFSWVGNNDVHTDMAFWGKYAFQGSWLGFNVRDISAPGNPKPVSYTRCERPQGDMIIWEDVLVRTADGLAPAPFMCDGQPYPAGFGGLHIFDVSDRSNPVLIGDIEVPCGSHTATGVPDLENNRLLVYSSAARHACPQIDIVEIRLDDPGNPTHLRTVPSGRMCHDTGVILGDALRAACAGHHGYTMWSLDPADGASLENPVLMYSRMIEFADIGHSAAFSWDGSVMIFGHEPGGGAQARCQATSPDHDKSKFFFDTETGQLLGTWVLPRPQGPDENCTIHIYNVVPLRDGRNVMVGGHYQAGTWVVDFTNPASPRTLGWSDPPPEVPTDLGGAWATYWYNGFIFETHISEGLNVFRYSGPEFAGSLRLGHLNPQTQEFTLPAWEPRGQGQGQARGKTG